MRAAPLCLVWAILLWCSPAWAGGDDPVYLVAIGNNMGAADEVTLLYAERDARQVMTVFQELGRVRGDRAVLLTGASADGVRRALLEMNARIRRVKNTHSRLIVYYSGHADAKALHLGSTQLPLEEIKSIISGSPARVRMLFVDACRSGAVTRVKGVKKAPEFDLKVDFGDTVEGTAILTSSAAGENSQESDRLRGSFFTHHFVAGLRGAADMDQNGQVGLDEVYRYSYRQTLRSSGRSLQLQHPTFEYGIRGKGTVPLTWPLGAQRSTGQLRIKRAGRYLVTEGNEQGPVALDVAVTAKGATLALPQRKYIVQRREPTRYLEYEVNIEARKKTQLDGLPYRTVAYDRLLRKGGGIMQRFTA